MKNLFAAFFLIVFACSLPAEAQWIEVNVHPRGYVNALAANENGLSEGGSSRHLSLAYIGGWNTLIAGLPIMSVQSLAVSPDGTGGTDLFAGAIVCGVFLYTNNWTSWVAVDSGLRSTEVSSLALSANAAGGMYLLAGTYGGFGQMTGNFS